MSTRTGSNNPRLMIKLGRQIRGQTQQGLADALAKKTGKRWSRGMVANLESGHKTLDVDILVDISEIQDLGIGFYFGGLDEHMGAYLSSLEPAAA